MSASKNLEFEKTSFLNKSNSAFIERMYLKFVNKDVDLPGSWKNYFEGIGEELNIIAKEINGPSWAPKKNKISVVMDRCPKIEYSRLSGELGWAGINSGTFYNKRRIIRSIM